MREFNQTEILRVENLTKIYGPGCPNCIVNTGPDQGTNQCPECGSLVACANISFSINQGEILGIVGESGSGRVPLSVVYTLITMPQRESLFSEL